MKFTILILAFFVILGSGVPSEIQQIVHSPIKSYVLCSVPGQQRICCTAESLLWISKTKEHLELNCTTIVFIPGIKERQSIELFMGPLEIYLLQKTPVFTACTQSKIEHEHYSLEMLDAYRKYYIKNEQLVFQRVTRVIIPNNHSSLNKYNLKELELERHLLLIQPSTTIFLPLVTENSQYSLPIIMTTLFKNKDADDQSNQTSNPSQMVARNGQYSLPIIMTTLFENTDICNQSNLSQVEQVPNPISPVCYSPNPDSDDESS